MSLKNTAEADQASFGIMSPLDASGEDESFPTLEPGRALRLTLLLDDPEVVATLRRKRGRARERYAAEALKVGILALRAAGGQVDAGAIREAGSALVSEINELLTQRASELTNSLGEALTRYLDPKTGALPQRLDALVKQDGELERLLRSHMGPDNSTLAHTLVEHLGEGSDVFKMLSPTEADGLRGQLEKTLESALGEQREKVLREFSLDREDSALSRLVSQVTDQNGELREDLTERIDELVGQFTLDDEQSSLSRLKREVTTLLEAMQKHQNEFHSEVREILAAEKARLEEEKRSTRHGETFEGELGALLSRMAQRSGDVYDHTGNRVGVIRNCKKGDHTVELGPESSAPGECIVWEAKQEKKWDLKKALNYLEEARKNRQAQVGVFVFSRESAPEGLESFGRYGSSIVIIWDAEDTSTDVHVKAAWSLARFMVTQTKRGSDEADEAITEIVKATRTIERQIKYLEEFRKSGKTIVSSAEGIMQRCQKMTKQLTSEVERLDDQVDALRALDES